MSGLLRVGVAGVGGFAGDHHAALAQMEEDGECRVVATCDPDSSRVAAAAERFRFEDRQVRTFPGLSEMLAESEPDVVMLPTPIPLHAEHHRLAVASGAGCYLEKPPSLWWLEFQRMLETERQAKRATHVGFNFVGDPWRRTLKQRILNLEFGELREVRFAAIWPRDEAYYGRNDWGGRLKTGDRWVLDSPIGNAMAHYVQNLLFWAGPEPDSVAAIHEVRARLFRAHPIESYDTAYLSALLDGGARLRIAATHTGVDRSRQRETLVFDRARIFLDEWRKARVEYADGTVEGLESEVLDQRELLRHNFREYFAFVRGESPRPMTRLEDATSFVALCGLAFVSANGIERFAPGRIVGTNGKVSVTGSEAEMEAFVEEEWWPTEPGKPVHMSDLDRLGEVAARCLGT
jgi:predicted dehydrogenase